jgi:hypothetical protein
MNEYQASIEEYVYRDAPRPTFDGDSLELLEAFGAAYHYLLTTQIDVHGTQVSSAFERLSGQEQETLLAQCHAREERAIAVYLELQARLTGLLNRHA